MSYAALILLLIALALLSKQGAERTPVIDAQRVDTWSLRELVIASLGTLFAELAIIRWLGVEIRVFAYFKNLVLLLCFLGFGMGCALGREPIRWRRSLAALIELIIIVKLPLKSWTRFLELLSMMLGASADVEIWKTGFHFDWTAFIIAAAVTGFLLFFVASIFIPFGQVVSRQLELAPKRLTAYSWNLFASLLAIGAFLLVSDRMLPPLFWFSAILFAIALIQRKKAHTAFVLCLVPVVALLLRDPRTPNGFVSWTPYQQIGLSKFFFKNGELAAENIFVNRTGYQRINNLSAAFLAAHPGLLKEGESLNPYNLPFRFAGRTPRVLVVGAGAGNDAAAAVRNGSVYVDAVEIDPAIYQIGKSRHPEHPYDSPIVHMHITDARAFLRRTHETYDLILFGLLDSHTQFSDYSNMRIDNFVYTRESFLEAKRHLAPGGVLFVKFEVNRPWMGKRMEGLLSSTFGKEPLMFFADSWYTSTATCFVISDSDRVENVLASDQQLKAFASVRPDFVGSEAVPVTTDDWPYLYNKGRYIPRTYESLSLLVILLGVALYTDIPEARQQRPSLFFFAMGSGFMLLETQVISRLALFFGTTWQVNGIVIGSILTMLLLANFLAERRPEALPSWLIVACLLGSVLMAFFIPFERIPASTRAVGALAAFIFSIPVFFAGLLFSREFGRTPSPVAALAANMLGAVAGGLLETLSLVLGMRALLLVAFALYAVAATGLALRHRVADRELAKIAAAVR